MLIYWLNFKVKWELLRRQIKFRAKIKKYKKWFYPKLMSRAKKYFYRTSDSDRSYMKN